MTPSSPSILPEPPPGCTWVPIPNLSDEFNAVSLDPKKWLDHHPYWSGRTPSQHDPANVSLKGGMLHLVSTTDVDNLDQIADPKTDNWVRAAALTSRAPVASYGYYEARLRASQLSMTSSFWFQGEYSEIDIVEQLGSPRLHPGRRKLNLVNTHYYPDGWENDCKTPREIPMRTGSGDDFHVYGVWWKDAQSAWFYLDGALVTEIDFGGAFDEPMYMFFDTEVFTWEGLPDVEALKDAAKNTMLVDWVRAWELIQK